MAEPPGSQPLSTTPEHHPSGRSPGAGEPQDATPQEGSPGEQEEVDEEEALVEETDLWTAFRERVIHIPSMPGRLRLATGLAMAWLLVAIILIAIRGFPITFPSIQLYAADGQLVETSIPVFAVSVILLVAAWTYLVAGSLHAHWLVRAAGLVVFTVAMWQGGAITLPGDAWHTWVGIALLVLLWGIGVGGLLHDRRRAAQREEHRAHWARLIAGTTFGVLIVVAGIYTNAYLAHRGGRELLFTNGLTLQLFTLSAFLVPALLIAGVDFADWAELTGGRVNAALNRVRVAWLLPLATGVAALAIGGFWVWTFRAHLDRLGADLAVGLGAVVLIGGLVVLLSRGTRFHHHVPYGAIVVAVLIGYAVPYLYIFVPAYQQLTAQTSKVTGALDENMSPYRHEAAPQFTILKPTFWEVGVRSEQKAGGGFTNVVVDGFKVSDPAIMMITAFPVAAVPGPHAMVQLQLSAFKQLFDGQTPYLMGATTDHGWEAFDFATAGQPGASTFRGREWVRTEDGQTWGIMAVTTARLYAYNSRGFDRAAASWEPRLVTEAATAPAPAGATVTQRALVAALLVMLVLEVLLILGLLTGRFGTHARRVATATLFLGMVTILTTAALPQYVMAVITNHQVTVTPFHIEGIQTLVAIASLAFVAWLALQRRLAQASVAVGLVLGLNLALQVVSWIYDLYAQAMVQGRFSVAQAAIILLALMWDVTMSGESITNRGSRWFPRHSRVLLFFGYTMLVTCLVLYFSSLQAQATGRAVEPQFESDGWPQSGLIEYGIPVLLSLFAIRFLNWWRNQRGVSVPEGAEA